MRFSLFSLKVVVGFIFLAVILSSTLFLDYSLISRVDHYELPLYLLVTFAFLIPTHITWGLKALYIPIVPFAVFSFVFYWLSFLLLHLFGSYQPSENTYLVSIVCYFMAHFTFFIFGWIGLKSNVHNIDNLKREMVESIDVAEVKFIWFVGVFLSFLFTTLFFIKAGNIPMLAENPEIARIEAMKGAGTIQRLSYLPMYFAIFSLSILCWLQNRSLSSACPETLKHLKTAACTPI